MNEKKETLRPGKYANTEWTAEKINCSRLIQKVKGSNICLQKQKKASRNNRSLTLKNSFSCLIVNGNYLSKSSSHLCFIQISKN